MSGEKLEPCPFCGPGRSHVELWHDDVAHRWRVGCGRCGCSTGTSPRDKTQAPAIAAWNTRAAGWQPIGAGLNADEVALVLAENARIENGELRNVSYLAVKIAEQADERGRTALNALQKIGTGHIPGERDNATTAAVMRGIAVEALTDLGVALPTTPQGEG